MIPIILYSLEVIYNLMFLNIRSIISFVVFRLRFWDTLTATGGGLPVCAPISVGFDTHKSPSEHLTLYQTAGGCSENSILIPPYLGLQKVETATYGGISMVFPSISKMCPSPPVARKSTCQGAKSGNSLVEILAANGKFCKGNSALCQ